MVSNEEFTLYNLSCALFITSPYCYYEQSLIIITLLGWERLGAAVTSVPAVYNAFLERWVWCKIPVARGKSGTCLATRVRHGFASVTAPVEQERIQKRLRPVRRIVQTAVKSVMKAWPQSLGGVLRGGRRQGSRHRRRGWWDLLSCHLGRPRLPVLARFGRVGLAMELHVFAQWAWVRVTFLTASDLAHIRLVARMDVRMLLPVTAVCKPPVAALELAFERFLT